MKAFTIMWRVIKSAYEELFLCVGMSLLWWAGLFLVVTGAPATMGIEHVANRLANYKRADSGFFWESARLHLRQGFFLFWLSVIVPPALAFNVWFYANSEGWLRFISLVWLWVLLLWLLISQYLFPLFWQQDEPNIRLAFRNAALLTAKYPLYSLLLFLFQILLIFICVAVVLPLPLLLPAMIALAQNFGTLGLLQEMGLAPEPPEAEVDRRG